MQKRGATPFLLNYGEKMASKEKKTYPIKFINVVNKCVYLANNADEEKTYNDNPNYKLDS